MYKKRPIKYQKQKKYYFYLLCKWKMYFSLNANNKFRAIQNKLLELISVFVVTPPSSLLLVAAEEANWHRIASLNVCKMLEIRFK